MNNLLIILSKNPQKGKVKTRLAKTIGDDNALLIYKKLLTHTANFAKPVLADKTVFYSKQIGNETYFENKYFEKELQEGNDLGEKMKNAFKFGFDKEYKNIVIIGSDCYTLTTDIINKAFENLNKNNFVIGPAFDGGYYLLGMNRFTPQVFDNKTWSTETVFEETITDIKQQSLSFALLPKLSDVDYEEDLVDELKILIKPV